MLKRLTALEKLNKTLVSDFCIKDPRGQTDRHTQRDVLITVLRSLSREVIIGFCATMYWPQSGLQKT